MGDFMSNLEVKASASGTGKVTIAAPVTNVDRVITLPDVSGTLLFTQEFDSGPQTITSGGLLTLTHGLGREPRLFDFHLVCITAEDGYSIGDKIPANINSSTSTANRINTYYFSSTQISFRFSDNNSCFSSGTKSSGQVVAQNNSNWNLVVRAYA
jgi:hypothetical protein